MGISENAIVNLLVAAISFVLGPVLVVVVTNYKKQQSAKNGHGKAANPVVPVPLPREGAAIEALMMWAEKRARDADAKVQTLRTEVEELRERLGAVETEVAVLRNHNAVLAAQVIQLGGTPLGFPGDPA